MTADIRTPTQSTRGRKKLLLSRYEWVAVVSMVAMAVLLVIYAITL